MNLTPDNCTEALGITYTSVTTAITNPHENTSKQQNQQTTGEKCHHWFLLHKSQVPDVSPDEKIGNF